MGSPRPYRKREPVARPPCPPTDATFEEIEAWRRDVWEPWDARRRARQDYKALAPHKTPTAREAAHDAAVDELARRCAEEARRPPSERVAEISWEEIASRHGL